VVPTHTFGILSWSSACFVEFDCWKVGVCHWLVESWFILVLLWLVVRFLVCQFCFLQIWVQGGHSFKSIYWPFVGGLLVGTVYNLPWTLVACSSSSSPEHLQREVLCDYPAVKGVGYQVIERDLCWYAVLNPEYQSIHNQENQSYLGASIGFGLTYQSEIRRVQGNCYLCTLGRGSNSLLPLGLPLKLKAKKVVMGQHHGPMAGNRGI